MKNARKLGEFISNTSSGQSINYYSHDKKPHGKLGERFEKHFMQQESFSNQRNM